MGTEAAAAVGASAIGAGSAPVRPSTPSTAFSSMAAAMAWASIAIDDSQAVAVLVRPAAASLAVSHEYSTVKKGIYKGVVVGVVVGVVTRFFLRFFRRKSKNRSASQMKDYIEISF